MSWAKVKKINSDMSTPLDVLFKGSKRIGASDETYAVVSSRNRSGYITFGNFVSNFDGSIRIIANGGTTTSTGSVMASVSGEDYKISFTNQTETKTIDVPVSAGDSVTIKQTGDNMETHFIKIGARLIDNTLGEFIPV